LCIASRITSSCGNLCPPWPETSAFLGFVQREVDFRELAIHSGIGRIERNALLQSADGFRLIYTNDRTELARNLSRDNSQRTGTDTPKQQPAGSKIEPASATSERPPEQEQGHNLGMGL
jgi:hypothetical protein